MRIIRYSFIAILLTVGAINPAAARVNIDLNLSLFPDLVPVPGYPVYYAPAIDSNYFFYDGRYWLFDDDDWYESAWYNGPWEYVDREYVPIYLLRIPVRYYRRPPPYFRGWRYDASPRWGEHWGEGWERHHRGWDEWDRHHVPARAPLPSYQRDYSRDRYPDRDEQREIHERNYRYQPRDADRREHDRDASRINGSTQPDRRDEVQRSHPTEQHREMPRPQNHNDENSSPSGRDRAQQFDQERIKRVQPVPQIERHDNRPSENVTRERPQPRDDNRGHSRDRDNNGGHDDRTDRGEGKR